MRRSVMRRLVLETTAPFQGLPELVAYHEGLFEREGLVVEWVDREAGAGRAARLPRLHPAATGQPDHRRALLLRHALHRAPHAGRFPPARHDQAVPGPERLALPPRVDAARRGRGDDLDGTSPVAR